MRSSCAGPRLLALVVLLAAPLLAACGESDPRDDAPVLQVAWTSEAEGWDAYDAPWTADDDIWIYRDHESAALLGIGLDDGAVEWSLPSSEICALSAVTEGSVAVQSGPSCTRLSLLDTGSGQERWSTQVRFPAETYPTDRGLSVGLSERTVTVATRCGIERWSVADGSFEGRLAARGDGAPRCLPSATTGDLALVADRSGLIGYDADSGERLWAQPGANAAVHRIHAADPLLADIALGDVRALRRIDPATGEPGPVLGRPLPTYGPGIDIADPVGDVVIGAYHDPAGGFEPSYASAVRAWAADTGEQQWDRTAAGDEYLGRDDDGFHVGRSITGEDDGEGYGYWVMRWGPGDTEPRTLGWIQDQVLQSKLVGDLLVVGGSYGKPTTAYRLPQEAEELPVPAGRDTYADPEWAEGDLRSDPTVDPCAAVTPQTLRGLGFAGAADRPAPLDCRWAEGNRVLTVSVDVHPADDDGSGVDAARQRVADLRSATEYGEVDGSALGDEVWQQDAASVGTNDYTEVPGRTSSNGRLLVREANVVVHATFDQGIRDSAVLPISGARVQAGLRDVVQDALTTWEEPDRAEAPAGQDGTITTVPDPCRTLARSVRPPVLRAEPTDLTEPGEERLRGCLWQPRQYGDLVQVTAYAVGPDAITGATATEEATAIVAADEGAGSAERVRGPWDEGWRTGERRGTYQDSARLVVRVDNLVVVVQVSLSGDERALEPGSELARSTAGDLARTYLAAVRTAEGEVPATP